MIANVQNSNEVLTGIEKAAILMVMLGDQISGELLKMLNEDEVQLVSRQVARLKKVTPQEAELVLEEFYQLTAARDYVAKGGLDYARTMLFNAFGPEAARRLMDRLVKAPGRGHGLLRCPAEGRSAATRQVPAQRTPADHRAGALAPQPLPGRGAAGFPAPELRGDVALRVASLDQISPDVINKIAVVIGQKLNALGEFSRESYGGVRAVAEMFNRLDGESQGDSQLHRGSGSNLVETIRHLMFVFEDILLIDPNGLKEVLARVDRKVTMALKGTAISSKSFPAMHVAARRGNGARRHGRHGAGKDQGSRAAQQHIIGVIRQLEAEGILSMRGTVGEQYVV